MRKEKYKGACDQSVNLRVKTKVPKNKIPLFIKVWGEIKEMGGGKKGCGIGANPIDDMIHEKILTVEMAHKILKYHKTLKAGIK